MAEDGATLERRCCSLHRPPCVACSGTTLCSQSLARSFRAMRTGRAAVPWACRAKAGKRRQTNLPGRSNTAPFLAHCQWHGARLLLAVRANSLYARGPCMYVTAVSSVRCAKAPKRRRRNSDFFFRVGNLFPHVENNRSIRRCMHIRDSRLVHTHRHSSSI